MISRTVELDDDDVTNNRVHYYLPDAQGGSVGMLLDDDGDPTTPGHAAFQTYDAFGNAMSKTFTAAGSFAWRGAEGSVTDREPNLVHMQARHYDPTIGRFIQPDALLTAGMTTQGLNRYIYCENDPVNRTDPTGSFPLLVGLLGVVLYGVGFWAGMELARLAGGGGAGPLLRFVGVMLGALAGAGASVCWLTLEKQLMDLTKAFMAGTISYSAWSAAFGSTLFGFMGVVFGLGFVTGFAVGMWFSSADEHPDDEPLRWRRDEERSRWRDRFAAVVVPLRCTGCGQVEAPGCSVGGLGRRAQLA